MFISKYVKTKICNFHQILQLFGGVFRSQSYKIYTFKRNLSVNTIDGQTVLQFITNFIDVSWMLGLNLLNNQAAKLKVVKRIHLVILLTKNLFIDYCYYH